MRSEDFDTLKAANKKLIDAHCEERPVVKGDYEVEIKGEHGVWKLGWGCEPLYNPKEEDPSGDAIIERTKADLIFEQLRCLSSNYEVLKILEEDLRRPVPCRYKGEERPLICFTWGLDSAEYVKRALIIPSLHISKNADTDDAEVGYIQFARNPLLTLQTLVLPPEEPMKGEKYHSWVWGDLVLPWAGLIGQIYRDRTLEYFRQGMEIIFSDGVARIEDGKYVVKP